MMASSMSLRFRYVAGRAHGYDRGRDEISSRATDTDTAVASGLLKFVPAFDGLRAARLRADVDGRRAAQFAEPLLFKDVSTPPGGAAAGEHRRHHLGGHTGEVQNHRSPELDIGFD